MRNLHVQFDYNLGYISSGRGAIAHCSYADFTRTHSGNNSNSSCALFLGERGTAIKILNDGKSRLFLPYEG